MERSRLSLFIPPLRDSIVAARLLREQGYKVQMVVDPDAEEV
jgi:hypothetical protein